MLSCILFVTCLFGWPPNPSLAGPALNQVKNATVFIRVQRGSIKSSGTGCLIHKKGKTGLIATNAHVLRAPGAGPGSDVQVVFHSGQDHEFASRAEIVAVDSTQDLAILQVEVAQLPPAIRRSTTQKLKETQVVHIFGFPFGEALASRPGNPNVTIGLGSISSLHRGLGGMIERIQIDGDVNPGNSGGPIVDGAGTLVGITVAKVAGTQIGFAIPPAELDALLSGRVRETTLTETQNAKGMIKFAVAAELADPLKNIQKVWLLIAPKGEMKNPPAAQPGGNYSRMQGAKELLLSIRDGRATGSLKLQNSSQTPVTYVVQTRYLRAKKENVITMPQEVQLDFNRDAGPRPRKAKSDVETSEDSEPVPKATEKITKLAEPIVDFCLARGGRFLVLRLANMAAMLIYDTYTAEVVKTIRIPSNRFVFAAGGDTAVAYIEEENVFQSWDLQTFEKIKTKPNPFGGKIHRITMGHARGDQAVVQWQSDANRREGLFFLATTTLEPIMQNGEWMAASSRVSFGHGTSHLRASSNLDYLSEWSFAGSPSGLTIHSLSGSEVTSKYEHQSVRSIVIGDDRRLYCGNGDIYHTDLRKIGSLEGLALYPGVGGTLFVSLSDAGKVTVYPAGQTSPLIQWGGFPDWKEDWKGKLAEYNADGLSIDKHIVFLPTTGRIVFIPFPADRIILKPFDLRASLKSSGIDHLAVISSPKTEIVPRREWKYQIEALSNHGGLTYKLDFAPEGMTASTDGLLTWQVPARINPDGERVIVVVGDKSGAETFHSFTLTSSQVRTVRPAGKVHVFRYVR